MKRFNNFHSINIFSLELTNWDYEIHKHNFYELIFIEKGEGIHKLNNLELSYKKGDVFLLTPNDAHEFCIQKKTIFTFIKFNEQILKEMILLDKKYLVKELISNILSGTINTNDSIIKNNKDKINIFSILQIIKIEHSGNNLFSRKIVLELLEVIITILFRNINGGKSLENIEDKNMESEKLNSVLSYIRINALDSEKMKIKNMANYFSMSPNYISIYVKKHTGISIQQHVIKTKITYAENMLEQNKFNINEISSYLGFNDASHFNKIFKKYKNILPSRYRYKNDTNNN